MPSNDQHTTRHSDAKGGHLPWLLAAGAGLAGASFSCNSTEYEKLVEPPTLEEAIQFPKNVKPGIALIQVDHDALDDPGRIVQEFQRAHPDLAVLGTESFVELIPEWGKRCYVKVVYELGPNSEHDAEVREGE